MGSIFRYKTRIVAGETRYYVEYFEYSSKSFSSTFRVISRKLGFFFGQFRFSSSLLFIIQSFAFSFTVVNPTIFFTI